MFMATSRLRSPSTIYSRSIISRMWSTSWSVSWDTRRASGSPIFSMISWALAGPMPWIYCNATTTRLLVGILTPAIRAKAVPPVAGRAPAVPPHLRLGQPCLSGQSAGQTRLQASAPRPNPAGVGKKPAPWDLKRPTRRPPLLPGAAASLGCLELCRLLRDSNPVRQPPATPRSARENPIDGPADVRDRGHAVDRLQRALFRVVIGQRSGLHAIGGNALLQRFGIVVGANGLAALLHLGNPLLDSLQQLAFVHLELDHRVELHILRIEHAVERLGLGNGARKTVQDEALGRVRLLDPVGHDGHYDVVGAEVAARHDGFSLAADRRAGLDRGAQHVAGRELHDAMFLDQALRLRAFAGTRGAEHDEPHGLEPSCPIGA